jgi:hypothetical protein
MSDARVLLSAHLDRMIASVGVGHYPMQMADGILANPQAHIDALIAAGVLEAKGKLTGGIGPAYVVIRPTCTAWIEVGFGRQTCVEPAGHDTKEGDHVTPHRSHQPTEPNAPNRDTIWYSSP